MLPLNTGTIVGVYVASWLFIDDTHCQLRKDMYHRGYCIWLVISDLTYIMHTAFICRKSTVLLKHCVA